MRPRLMVSVRLACLAATLPLVCPSHAQAQVLTDRLRQIVIANAPILIHETLNASQNHEAYNQLLKIDFDGDQIGSNNTSNVDAGNVVDGSATAYFSIAESGTSTDQGTFYIGYYFYHPRDGGQQINTPLIDLHEPGHEHDLEGIWVMVEKSPYYPNGILDIALTEAHGALIPYYDPLWVPLDYPVGPSNASAAGQIHKWADTYGVSRAVVAIRRSTHGTYMAQSVDQFDPDWDRGYGIVTNRQSTDPYTAYVHQEANAIFYFPYPNTCYPSFPCAPRLGPSVNSGNYFYNLINVADAPFWTLRASTDMFAGTLRDLGGGQQGYDFFHSSTGSLDANPPWAWTGGQGICQPVLGTPECWYSFGVDNTQGYYQPQAWPSIPFGRLLTDPYLVSHTYWPSITWSSNILFNQFGGTSSPPPPPLSASINGPTEISSCYLDVNHWLAGVTGGTPPYTYRWSGDVSGTDSYVEGYSTSDMLVALDVWDAQGQWASASIYAHNNGTQC